MKKSDKKYENGLRVGLTNICEQALENIDGFQWLTHLVDYNHFPQSLKIVLVFADENHISAFTAGENKQLVEQRIANLMHTLGINIKQIHSHILCDSEASCALQHQGDWSARFSCM